MAHGIFRLPDPINEPVLNYGAGSPERAELQAKLKELSRKEIEIPLVIGGKAVKTGKLADCVVPHDHGHVLARYHLAGKKEVQMAIKAAATAWTDWSAEIRIGKWIQILGSHSDRCIPPDGMRKA